MPMRTSSASRRSSSRLLAGESMALVSDAGTPGISDPGAGSWRGRGARRHGHAGSGAERAGDAAFGGGL